MNTVQSHDGTTIAFDRTGDGPPLVLVGGAFQYRAFDPRTTELAALLSADFTVWHYDRRGRGDSGNTAPYSTRREIDDLNAILGDAGRSAAVFAMSSGGALALDAAAAGTPISRLALYEPSFIVDDSRAPLPDDYVSQLQNLPAGDAAAYFLTVAAEVSSEVVAGMRQSPMWAGFEAVAPTLAYDAAFVHPVARGLKEPLQRWAGVQLPTLLLTGSDSPTWVQRTADALADVLPHANRQLLTGQTHDVTPDVLAPAITTFFRERPAQG